MLTLSELAEIMSRAGASAALYLEPLNTACDEFDIDNPDRLSAWLANIAVESRELTRTSENMMYTTPGRIADVWPSRFPSASHAEPYAGHPERLANVVYAGRNGNGPIESGDGWRFRGGGLLMATGRSMYAAIGAHFSMSADDAAQWVRTPVGAARSAGFVWWSKACNPLADQGQFATVVRKITGPSMIAYRERLEFFARARRTLGAEA